MATATVIGNEDYGYGLGEIVKNTVVFGLVKKLTANLSWRSDKTHSNRYN
ncbi:5926_t:CDS:2, partial [Racocetra fulgida]